MALDLCKFIFEIACGILLVLAAAAIFFGLLTLVAFMVSFLSSYHWMPYQREVGVLCWSVFFCWLGIDIMNKIKN